MTEHIPWRGPDYESGLDGQRIAIVGYSHFHKRGETDRNNFTLQVLRAVVNGTQKDDSFFPPIPGYFGYDDNAAFWNRVLFFNFLLNRIGDADRKYGMGTPAHTRKSEERFLRILQKEKPDKVFVFTRKGWEALQQDPNTANTTCTPLGTGFSKFSWRTYFADGHIVLAFGIRHPQGANCHLMRLAVHRCLRMSVKTKWQTMGA